MSRNSTFTHAAQPTISELTLGGEEATAAPAPKKP
eukprot:CAMPEP_0172889676 /NCGR_PEP_ID=MMETSP1075-20121228/139435_1 /TAXON_ID=2916 /ORGANISM="Ceratium fusus, Strain PA161109" /LENGTH=34 /DNA_ID= /DNA_START= /DNA_END= /DNA_ORIENTATION=